MKILELRAENFKKLRVVEIRPDGNMVNLTGRNGQGKTSVLDAIWFALKGKKALPMKPVRKGTERMKVSLETEEFTVTRTLGRESAIPTIVLEMKQGKTRDKTPQDFLDELIGELTFDPLEFLSMTPKDQVAALRKTAKLDYDFEAADDQNKTDYDERTGINREVSQLNGQINGMTILDGLPKEKIDESAILKQLNDAGESNRKALEISQHKQDLGAEASRIGAEKVRVESQISRLNSQIEALRLELAAAEKQLKILASDHLSAETKFEKAPKGETVDTVALTTQLTNAQRTNRAIDQRTEWERLRDLRTAKQKKADALTRQIDAREEKKRDAIAKAKIPVEGITFDESQVLFNGLPLENLGEGEQIRISTQIGMAANPKLRVLCIRHGEALDEDGMKVVAGLAEEHNFQVWMARVDSSGKVGIVLEDGEVVDTSEEG